jgi:hypothetical protein
MSRTDAIVEAHQAHQDAQHQAGIDAADQRDAELDDYIDEAIDAAMDDARECVEFLLPVLESDGPSQPMDKLQASLDADTLSDWLRLLMRAPVADADVLVLNMRLWMRDTMAAAPSVVAAAERLMAQDDADAKYTAAQDRAERIAEEPTWFRL